MRTRSDLDSAELRSALVAAAERTAQLIRSASDTSTPVPGLTWTVGETAAHLVGAFAGYAGFLDGSRDAVADLAGMPGANTPAERGDIMSARILQEITERDGDRLADLLASAVTGYLEAVEGRRLDEPILVWTGVAMTVPVMTSAMLGELLLHGCDIARATGARPTIDRHQALLVIAGIVALIPEYVDREKTRGLRVTYELRFRGGRRYVVAIDNGTAQIDPPGARVDCWISVDPAAFLLVGYGRVSQWGQTLRGRMLSGGRKPWLGLKFGQLVSKV
ncbi:MAG: maleylpyruvate isomerase family mycothiol-dependent enzyme [Actinobacteria bacterium]|nr:maleylpyruvate isomerase family mycothiol-dependent enzyme [Actinomycetota bacterium]